MALLRHNGYDTSPYVSTIVDGGYTKPDELMEELNTHIRWLCARSESVGRRDAIRGVLTKLRAISGNPEIDTPKQYHHAIMEMAIVLSAELAKEND
jgi:hypothetical protein